MDLERFWKLLGNSPKPFEDLSGNSQESSRIRSESFGPSYASKQWTCRKGDPPNTSTTVQSMGIKCPQVAIGASKTTSVDSGKPSGACTEPSRRLSGIFWETVDRGGARVLLGSRSRSATYRDLLGPFWGAENDKRGVLHYL